MQISEKILLIVTAAITGVAAFFCVIGLATPRWTIAFGLFCSDCSSASALGMSKASGGLSIVAFLLLVAAVVLLLLFTFKILPASVRAICLIVLLLAGIFTLSAFAAYFDSVAGYSYKLMVVAHFLCYVASVLAAFWLGSSYTAHVTQAN